MLLFYYNAKVKRTIQMTGIGTVVPAVFVKLESGEKHATPYFLVTFESIQWLFYITYLSKR